MGLSSIFLGGLVVIAAIVGAIQAEGEATSHSAVASSTSTDPSGSITSIQASQTTGGSGELNADTIATIAKTLGDNPALAAAAAAAFGGGGGARGYNYPPPPTTGPGVPGVPGGVPGGFPGGFPFLPFGGGFGKGLHVNVDAGAGFGGIGPYYPIIEKVIVIVGGGILILLIIAFIQGSLSPGGFLHALTGSFSKAIAGSAEIDLGPIHKSAAGAASFNLNDGLQIGGGRLNDPRFNQQVQNSFDRRF